MQISRRQVIRRLGGLFAAGLLWRATEAAARAQVQHGTPHQPPVDGSGTTPHSAGPAPAPSPTTTNPPTQVTSGRPTMLLSGPVGPLVVPKGETASIAGNVELTGDLVVEGRLTGIDTFLLRGNGFQILIQNGGSVDLRGKPKTGWTRGGTPTGWQTGDRVVTAPTAPNDYTGFRMGTWPVGRPPGVRLVDGRWLPAEQFNLDRSIVIDGVSRIMFRSGAGPSVLKHLAVRNAGITGRAGFFPLHWHNDNGDSTRGTLVEGVVVENGRNHAFVPHGSHGITFVDCVAYNTIGDAYWWNPPGSGVTARFRKFDTSNNTDDLTWKHCLAALVQVPPGEQGFRLTGFALGAGSGNRCLDCTAVGVQGTKDASGFHWPEESNQNVGGTVWRFEDCVAHNNRADGIFVWQNDKNEHLIRRFVAYRCGDAGIEHGAYLNAYRYEGIVVQESGSALKLHALSDHPEYPISFVDLVTDGPVVVTKHNLPSRVPILFQRCSVPRVVVNQLSNNGRIPGDLRFEDCRLGPNRFDLSGMHPDSVIELVERGRRIALWRRGAWR